MPEVTVPRQDGTEEPSSATPDRRADLVYVGAVALLGILLGIQTWQGGLGLDVYAHLATFRELSARPFEPLNPFVVSGDPTFYFSPYSVGLGVTGWLSGAGPVTLLHLGAAINLVLLTSGLWMFTRAFSPYRWAPHLTLFFSLFGWGLFSWRWSGYLNLNSIGFGLGYPSMFATGLALIALAGLCRFFTTRTWTTLAGVSVLTAVVALTHPLTAFWFAIAALAIALGQSLKTLRSTIVGLLVAAVVAITLVLVWPYYSFLALGTEASDSSAVHDPLYREILVRSFLLIPGVVALWYRARRSLRDPLVLMFVAGVAIYFIGYVADFHSLGRVMPLVALSAHVALADMVAGWLKQDEQRRLAIGTIVVVGAVGFVGSIPGLFWMIPRTVLPSSVFGIDDLHTEITPYRSLETVLDPTDVVFASPVMSMIVPSVTGRVVTPGYLTPLLSDRAARDLAAAEFFSANRTKGERAAIATTWAATHVVVEPADVAIHPWLERDYLVTGRTDDYVVFLIRPEAGER